MAKYLVSQIHYPDRNPPETHYLLIDESHGEFNFRAGAVIGRGVAAGGGEGVFSIDSLQKVQSYRKFLRDIKREWIDEILSSSQHSETEKYLMIIERSKEQ
ncbi:MAG: hypothetical protein CMI02_02010 [Oceanospirillaceae bacterium]|nr:hypothetical protein [Oceanospirillaceae bacterium]MBT10795.1 hypothetical protein [Oceanospirillaceae bacterium]|tara:strand:- start:504 stop:806 length:303 start_codon:yes stop_codon:yes gene_type:complete